MPRILLEVIVQTVADARAAAEGGADRLEIVRAIRSGGLTPPLALVTAIAAAVPLPLRVMVRENAGYDTDPSEVQALQRAAAEFAGIGVDGLVAGFSKRGALSVADLSVVLDAAPAVPLTFHRAFDAVSDPLGRYRPPYPNSTDRRHPDERWGRNPARNGAQGFATYSARAGARLAIIAGGGVDEEAFALFAKAACVRVIHVGRAARDGQNPDGPVSAAQRAAASKPHQSVNRQYAISNQQSTIHNPRSAINKSAIGDPQSAILHFPVVASARAEGLPHSRWRSCALCCVDAGAIRLAGSLRP